MATRDRHRRGDNRLMMMLLLPMWMVLTSMLVVRVSCAGVQGYDHDEIVPVLVNTVGPISNPSETYEFMSLPFCPDSDGIVEQKPQTLGETIKGDRQIYSLYEINFARSSEYEMLCSRPLSAADIFVFKNAIEHTYYYSMLIGTSLKQDLSNAAFYGLTLNGFVGVLDPYDTDEQGNALLGHFLFTHLHFTLLYNGRHIIHANLTADSEYLVNLDTIDENDTVTFSYSVEWIETEIAFKDRSKLAARPLTGDELEIHWLSIMNSLVLVLLLTAFVALILSRVLSNDYSRYSKQDLEADAEQEDYGWKLVHADVFRFPDHKNLFCASIGAGAQLLAVATSILGLSTIGVLYTPGEENGSGYTAAIALYALTSAIGGGVSSGFYKKLEGDRWAVNIVMSNMLFALPVALVTLSSNFFGVYYHTTSTLPLLTILQLLAIWIFISFPLSVIGGIAGRRIAGPFEAPVRTKKIPREIPSVPFYRGAAFHLLVGGLLPFSAIYIELYYIYEAVWGYATYTLYGILFIVFIILLLVTACMNIALTYFQLSIEDYRWWWRSFLSGSMTGIFMFAYSVFYWYYSDMSGVLQYVKYFAYVSLSCYLFCVMLGTVSFYTSLLFVRHIYKNLKCD